jgi:hypothetical protein
VSRLDAYSDNSRPVPRETCECGSRRSRWADACDRCQFLDGDHRLKSMTIEALRNSDLTLTELCLAVGRCPDRYKAGMLRCIRVLEKEGRIAKYESESDTVPIIKRSRYGGFQRATKGGLTCWRYTLDCKQRRVS